MTDVDIEKVDSPASVRVKLLINSFLMYLKNFVAKSSVSDDFKEATKNIFNALYEYPIDEASSQSAHILLHNIFALSLPTNSKTAERLQISTIVGSTVAAAIGTGGVISTIGTTTVTTVAGGSTVAAVAGSALALTVALPLVCAVIGGSLLFGIVQYHNTKIILEEEFLANLDAFLIELKTLASLPTIPENMASLSCNEPQN